MTPCIIYATKNGATEKAAKAIAERLDGCDTYNIATQQFDLSAYDTVIIGSNIRMGTVDKKIRRLLLEFIKPLHERRLAFFFCCAFAENEKLYTEQNIPPQLLEKAVAVSAVGCELDLNRLHGLDRIVANTVSNANREKGKARTFELNLDKIDNFVRKLNA